jgi:hypothetical protein
MNITINSNDYQKYLQFQSNQVPLLKSSSTKSKSKKFPLRKGKQPCWCQYNGECDTNAYWRWYSKEYCAKHLPKKAKELKKKGEYGITKDAKLSNEHY